MSFQRALIGINSGPILADNLAFRGGTAPWKLHLSTISALLVRPNMTPEARARQEIDWKLNLGVGLDVAVREYPTDTGPADYVLFVNREPV
jgi:hypothetical protein